MRCPFCGCDESKVIESRANEEGNRIRRRRECVSCQKRYTTYEFIETVPLMVLKKDLSIETFDRNKIMNGLVRACQKRPVSMEVLEETVSSIEQQLSASLDREIPSSVIGELIMEKLKNIDEVAYVRFASVYRQFADIESFTHEIGKLSKEKKKAEQKAEREKNKK